MEATSPEEGVDDSAVSAVQVARLAERGWVASAVEGMWENRQDGIGPVRFDQALEIDAGLRSSPGKGPRSRARAGTRTQSSPARQQRRLGARLTWLEEQLEVRDDVISRHVPGWSPGDSSVPPEEAIVLAFDALVAEGARAAKAAELARKQAKEAHSRGVEAGAVAAVLALGLLASAVALTYALWEHFQG
jgi:hypothetical protein